MYSTNVPGVADTWLSVHSHWDRRSQTRESSARDRVPGFTIALAREAGAQGTVVGREVGSRLGWPVYDHELLTLIAKDMGLHARLLENVDERGVSGLREFVKETMAGFGQGPVASEYTYARHLMEALVALGMLGECVIVGRGAAQLLSPDTTLRVRLVGPRADRIANIGRQFHLSLRDAERRTEEIDRERRTFIQRHFRKDPTDPDNYDLLLNVSRFTPVECGDLIIEALRRLQARRSAAQREQRPAKEPALLK
jgi:hypothetical protein